jgi:poly-gamma-glutamate synthesis protein (capsule biosynthesis protein)
MTDIAPPGSGTMRIFLSGDVMPGRGIDQILPHPCSPELYEPYMGSAAGYVRLAESATGPIPRGADPPYIWGAALSELAEARPDLRIINLETSITRSDDYAPKGINYRMSPENAVCLQAAGIDCCVLANNHVLDWGDAGLRDTLAVLEGLRIKAAGAGRNREAAEAPAILEVAGKGRVIVFAVASVTSGTPRSWTATDARAGVNVLSGFSDIAVAEISEQVGRIRQPGDIVIVSIHWGSNWGYDVPKAQQRFARALVADAGVTIVHGHSSHHPKGIELFRDGLILYGCGDFLNDYEGIQGYEEFRDDLALIYLADVDAGTRKLTGLEMVPLQIRHFQLIRAPEVDIAWLQQMLDRECRRFGGRVSLNSAGRLTLSRSLELSTAS